MAKSCFKHNPQYSPKNLICFEESGMPFRKSDALLEKLDNDKDDLSTWAIHTLDTVKALLSPQGAYLILDTPEGLLLEGAY